MSVLYIPCIVSASKFIAVQFQMLFADQMVNSYDATFQLAPKALDTIRMITTFDIFTSMMVYYFMLVIFV